MRIKVADLMRRTSVWMGVFIAFGFAFAQGFSHFDFRDLLAADLEAVAIACPGKTGAPTDTFACIRHWAPEDIVRMEMRLAFDQYSNVESVGAWEQEPEHGYIGRVYIIEMDAQDYAFYVIVDDDYPTMTDTVISIAALEN